MMGKFTFTFPAEVQREREALQQTIHELTSQGTFEAVREAQERLAAWLQQHPDDYVMWDAGEPLAMLADALQTQEAEPVHTS